MKPSAAPTVKAIAISKPTTGSSYLIGEFLHEKEESCGIEMSQGRHDLRSWAGPRCGGGGEPAYPEASSELYETWFRKRDRYFALLHGVGCAGGP